MKVSTLIVMSADDRWMQVPTNTTPSVIFEAPKMKYGEPAYLYLVLCHAREQRCVHIKCMYRKHKLSVPLEYFCKIQYENYKDKTLFGNDFNLDPKSKITSWLWDFHPQQTTNYVIPNDVVWQSVDFGEEKDEHHESWCLSLSSTKSTDCRTRSIC